LSYIDRGIATAKRNAFWEVHDNVPDELLVDGCDYCEEGWANGPGLVYRCQCNPGKAGEPDTIRTEPYPIVYERPSLGQHTVTWLVILAGMAVAYVLFRMIIIDIHTLTQNAG
jgi:hypothetical protein